MKRMTEDNLRVAFAGESQAHMKYLIFAERAESEGFPNVARLFRAIAFAEEVHARNHLEALGLIHETSGNLQTGIDGENYEIEEMYPAFLAVAKLQEDRVAQRTMNWALAAEKIHTVMYQAAKQSVDAGEDIRIGRVYICSLCGYTSEDVVPERCPVCGAIRDKFVEF